jgi:O-antigen ligase
MEGRSLFYIALVFVIVVNECRTVSHRWCALGAVLAGVTVQSVLSIEYLNRLDAAERDHLESLNEHGSTLGQVLLFVTLLSLVLFRVRLPISKWALLIAFVPTAYVFVVGERRAGAATLMIAGFYLAIALFWRRRRTFWLVTPVVALGLTVFVAAFSNSDSALGVQAGAIRSVVDPGAQSAADQSSDIYRDLEAFDLHFTIRTAPLTGLGFGHAFYRPWPLPDIASFPLSPFVPHNTILWIWIKLGFGGFVAMFYLFAKAIMLASDRVRHAAIDTEHSLTLTAACFISMYAVYSYVDISWDARNTVILGLALAVCASTASRSNPVNSEMLDAGHEEAGSPTPERV